MRDRSWLHDDVFTTLERYRAALCVHDLLDEHPWECTTDWTYVRFHGPHAFGASLHRLVRAATIVTLRRATARVDGNRG